jgi:hypothetical protein
MAFDAYTFLFSKFTYALLAIRDVCQTQFSNNRIAIQNYFLQADFSLSAELHLETDAT